jgi:hypothetical protein
MSDESKAIDTAIPAVNFTITAAERIRSLAAGPPAYAVRRRRIEDGEEAIVRDLVELLSKGADHAARVMRLGDLNRLIDAHNRYYPIEADLPIHPETGGPSERGTPWLPIPRATIEALTARASARRERVT